MLSVDVNEQQFYSIWQVQCIYHCCNLINLFMISCILELISEVTLRKH